MKDYSIGLAYEQFIADEMLETARLERFVTESILISEGTNTIQNIDVITEAFADKFKETIKKVVNAIINVWHKFLEGMNTLVKSDKAYLEKYKDTILKKQVKLGELTMPNYQKGMNEILNKKIPAFNYEGQKTKLADDKENSVFRKTIFTDYNPETDWTEFCKNKFKGGSDDVTIKGSQLNMTNLYNFCHEFDKFAKGIQAEIDNITKVGNQAIAIIDEKVRKTPKTEAGLFDNVKYFSYVYESFITEKVEGLNGDKDSKTQDDAKTDPNAKYKQGQVDGEHSKTDDTKQSIGSSDETPEQATANIQTYINVCGNFLAAKMTISRNCHKDYMSIIRAHVRTYTDTEEKKNIENRKEKDVDNNGNVEKEGTKEKVTNKVSNFFKPQKWS